METKTKKTTAEKQPAKRTVQTVSTKDRIKPRGLAGWMKGKIHYDENADIFNLGL
ncbi:hypothetical protein FACS1894181_17560 [Bacteroidia bacterium]|nr:hypothetical protein FACS1894181_17560 [Bacteroidia bacterium]